MERLRCKQYEATKSWLASGLFTQSWRWGWGPSILVFITNGFCLRISINFTRKMFPGCSLCGVSTILAIDYPSQKAVNGVFLVVWYFKTPESIKGIVMISIRDGATCLLWHDLYTFTLESVSFASNYRSLQLVFRACFYLLEFLVTVIKWQLDLYLGLLSFLF